MFSYFKDRQVIRRVRNLVKNAQTHQDLYDALDVAINYGKPLNYDHNLMEKIILHSWCFFKNIMLVFVVSYIFIMPICLFINYDSLYEIKYTIDDLIMSSGLSIVAVASLGGRIKNKYSRFKEQNKTVLEQIMMKDMLLDSGISIKPSAKKLVTKNLSKAILFKEGQWSYRQLLVEYEGVNLYDESRSPFIYYQIVFGINVLLYRATSTYTGKLYDNHKFGFMFQSDYKKRLLIASRGGYNFKYTRFLRDPYMGLKPVTTIPSRQFNRRYSVMSPNGEDISDVFSPKMIELFNHPRMNLSFDLEILPEGELIFQFHSNQILLSDLLYEMDQPVGGELKLNDPQLLYKLKEKNINYQYLTALQFIAKFKEILAENMKEN